ncbi:HAMP domain-containing sensor histidine kinase [Bacillus carboniphilus]|uniref:histidine kinase n=1 Tax=Bacillus carboniphilus TaxID=86663 RepID=A0ABY9JUU7_9BACI|nr:HAMP domain-containing sensor histidine kinase [Bacillus carboniphilus]WLR43165.1 HAMP domain-containing sensor histidine kinase [Bacillus carboniphilus]
MNRRVVFQFMFVIFLMLFLIVSIFQLTAKQYYYNGISQTIITHSQSVIKYTSFHDYSLEDGLSSETISELTSKMQYEGAILHIVNKDGQIIQSSTGLPQDGREEDLILVEQGIPYDPFYQVERRKDEKVLIVYSPLKLDGQTVAYLRYTTSLEGVNQVLFSLNIAAFIIGVLVSVIVFFVSLKLANSITQPIKEIIHVSSKMAQGQFNVRVKESYKDELGTLARTLNYLAEEIVRTEEMKNQFISSISHELRTPLTGIKGWSETLLPSNDISKEELKQGLQLISSETDRLILLVEELLDFSRFQNDKIALHKEEIDIEELLNDVLLQTTSKAENKQLSLVFEVPSYKVEVDVNRMKQVFLNLIDNAIKFSHEKGTIYIKSKQGSRFFHLFIQDEGIGINEKHIPYLTRPFYQVSHQQGTGLGLAISAKIIELHGGHLIINSQQGRGTVVTITLPK